MRLKLKWAFNLIAKSEILTKVTIKHYTFQCSDVFFIHVFENILHVKIQSLKNVFHV